MLKMDPVTWVNTMCNGPETIFHGMSSDHGHTDYHEENSHLCRIVNSDNLMNKDRKITNIMINNTFKQQLVLAI